MYIQLNISNNQKKINIVKTPTSGQLFTCIAYAITLCSHCHSMYSNWMARYFYVRL